MTGWCLQAKGESPTCFVASLVETEQRHGLTKKEAAWLAGILYGLPECIQQGKAQIAVQGVERVRTIDGDETDAVCVFHEYKLISHASQLTALGTN